MNRATQAPPGCRGPQAEHTLATWLADINRMIDPEAVHFAVGAPCWMRAPVYPGKYFMQTIEFNLAPDADYIEVHQLLKVTGLCNSGGEGKAMVADGMVHVDGAVETRKTAKIRAGQAVTCANVRIVVLGAVQA